MSLIKLAGIWDGIGKGLLAAGKHAMGNKVIRNAAIGAGVGAVGGAMKGGEGNRISGAIKGGLLGGVLGGGVTYGNKLHQNYNLLKNVNPGANSKQLLSSAFKSTGDAGISNTLKNSTNLFKQQIDLSKGQLPKLQTLGMR
jgi:hypothetical protein